MKLSRSTVALGLVLPALIIEGLSLLYWITFPYIPILSLFGQIDREVFHALVPFSPILLILLVYSWLGVLLLSQNNRVSKYLRTFLRPTLQSIRKHGLSNRPDPKSRVRLFSPSRLMLLVGMIAALSLALEPYRQDLNPTTMPIGVDAHYYIEWTTDMLQRPFSEALRYAMVMPSSGARPLLLVPLYLVVSSGLVSTIRAVETLPAILGPLFVFSVFIFVRETMENERLAGLAALVAAFSLSVTVGIWAAYYANLLALAIGYVFLTLLFRYWKKPSSKNLTFLVLSSLGVLLAHQWTWILVLSTISLFAAITWVVTRNKSLAKPVVLIIVIDAILGLVTNQLAGGWTQAQAALSIVVREATVTSTLNFGPNIVAALLAVYDGLLASTVVLGFSILALLSFDTRHMVHRLLFVWVGLSSIPILVFSPLIQTRLIYNLPIPVLTAIGLGIIVGMEKDRDLYSNLTLLLVILVFANYAFRAVISLVATSF